MSHQIVVVDVWNCSMCQFNIQQKSVLSLTCSVTVHHIKILCLILSQLIQVCIFLSNCHILDSSTVVDIETTYHMICFFFSDRWPVSTKLNFKKKLCHSTTLEISFILCVQIYSSALLDLCFLLLCENWNVSTFIFAFKKMFVSFFKTTTNEMVQLWPITIKEIISSNSTYSSDLSSKEMQFCDWNQNTSNETLCHLFLFGYIGGHVCLFVYFWHVCQLV